MQNVKHLVRANDPLTSLNAALATPKFSSGHKAIILEALKSGPMTAKEIERCTHLTVVQIDRRMIELARSKCITVLTLNDGADVVRGGCRVWRLV
jgi:hypothetical protein